MRQKQRIGFFVFILILVALTHIGDPDFATSEFVEHHSFRLSRIPCFYCRITILTSRTVKTIADFKRMLFHPPFLRLFAT